MQVKIYFTPVFDRKYKKYLKKYHSLSNDLKQFIENLSEENPVNMGGSIFKYRLSIESKNKGKSGGFRIITYLVTENDNNLDINFLIIYDKSEIEDFTKKELLEVVNQIFG